MTTDNMHEILLATRALSARRRVGFDALKLTNEPPQGFGNISNMPTGNWKMPNTHFGLLTTVTFRAYASTRLNIIARLTYSI